MYYKAKVFGDVHAARKILNATNAKLMKSLGRSVENFELEKWKQISILVIFKIYKKKIC